MCDIDTGYYYQYLPSFLIQFYYYHQIMRWDVVITVIRSHLIFICKNRALFTVNYLLFRKAPAMKKLIIVTNIRYISYNYFFNITITNALNL